MRLLERFAGGVGSLGGAVLALVVPPLCVVCDEPLAGADRWICGRCALVVASGARDRARSIALGAGRRLRVRYPLEYTPAVGCLVREMKYGGKPGLADYLARVIWEGAAAGLASDAVLVPVPLHPAKRRERGYNQSELLSRAIARLSQSEVSPRALVRARNTPPQAALDRRSRLTNVTGSLRAGTISGLGGRRVVLVDDVVTTGSTLRECARALLDKGVEDLQACAIASRDF
jgi:ComF family protein